MDNFFGFMYLVQDDYQNKISVIPFEGRPTYNDYFKLTEQYSNDINIISNKDIIIGEESLEKLKKWNWKNYCLALSRWDFVSHSLSRNESVHFNRPDSQDTWMVKGAFAPIKNIDFGLGIAGCDNAIAERLSQVYSVINPSLEIKTYHYHLTGVRNYLDENNLPKERVSPPYKLMSPTLLPL